MAVNIPSEIQGLPVVTKLVEKFRDSIVAITHFRREIAFEIQRDRLLDIALFLRDDEDLRFNFLADMAGVDRYPDEPRFEVNYHLLSIPRAERIRLKVRVPSEDAQVESVTSIWPTADWHEREVFDLFGILFANHPDLRRILTPPDWNGHPLRKDYPVRGYERS